MHVFDPTTLVGIHSLLSLVALIIGALLVLGEYFLVFVAIAQVFLKVPALSAAVAETQTPFAASQLAVLVAFGALGWLGVRAFRS